MLRKIEKTQEGFKVTWVERRGDSGRLIVASGTGATVREAIDDADRALEAMRPEAQAPGGSV